MPQEVSQVQGGSAPRGDRTFYYVGLFRTGLILLATLLLALARSDRSGLNLDRALPFLDSTLVIWCLFHLSVMSSFPMLGRIPRSLKLHVTADLIFSLSLVWWTGGVESFFLPILYANVLSTSTFYGLKTALSFATAATLTLVVMTAGMLKGWSPAQWTGITPFGIQGRVPFVVLCAIGQGIAFHLIAFLGARLTGGLRRAERFNNLIVDNIGEGIIALDERGRMILMNDEARRILGYPPQMDWKGKPPSVVFRREDDLALLELLESPEEGEQRLDWNVSRDHTIPLAVRRTRIPGDGSGSSLWLAVFRDRTLEVRVSDAEARLNRMKETEDMALGIVHEIRNPLASLRGCVQELARGELDEDQAGRFQKIILRESDRLDRIVNEFLEFSRTSPTRTESVDLALVLREVADSLRARPDASRVLIDTEGCSDSKLLDGQRELIYRLFLNLGINALEALQGQGRVAFRARAAVPDGWEVAVEDDGCGMEAETRARVFHPFFTTKPREGGLGLAIVERIVHGHGGTIEVRSTPEEGTCFRIWLPSREVNHSASSQPRDEHLEESKSESELASAGAKQ